MREKVKGRIKYAAVFMVFGSGWLFLYWFNSAVASIVGLIVLFGLVGWFVSYIVSGEL